jgi:hypothetical protein
VVPAIHIHPGTAIDLIRFDESYDQVTVTEPFNIRLPQSGMQDHDMCKGRALFENHFSLFEMHFQPVIVQKLQFVFFQIIEEYILAETMFAIEAFIIVHEIWHRFFSV